MQNWVAQDRNTRVALVKNVCILYNYMFFLGNNQTLVAIYFELRICNVETYLLTFIRMCSGFIFILTSILLNDIFGSVSVILIYRIFFTFDLHFIMLCNFDQLFIYIHDNVGISILCLRFWYVHMYFSFYMFTYLNLC